MNAIRLEVIIQNDGELRLEHLPCRKGERVEAILLLPDRAANQKKEAAKKRFLQLARVSKFRSEGPYPSREELHERS